MNRGFLTATLLSALLPALLAGSPPLWALESASTAGERSPIDRGEEQAFRKAISAMESSRGAYAPELSEQLLSLGLTLQSQGRHEEAVDLFKRGVHLARINNGLYSAEQIPLLQGQINSHIALGKYLAADERQQYMYRVQVRSMTSGQARTMALMQQANWQYNAYILDLGPQAYSRLMNMWDLYRLALNDIITLEGDESASLLLPLRGMLQAQYLISGYNPEDHSHSSPDDLGARQALNRFNAYRAQSFQKGSAVITAIHDIEQKNTGQDSVAAAEALLMLGDWQLWHDEKEPAWQYYQQAMVELAERDDAQVQVDRLLGTPVPLPDVDGVRPLPPAVDPEQGNILLEFGVSDRGRVVNLERVDESTASAGKANRLMRKLRKTRFRPRFEAGQRIETEKLVRAYVIE
jgi:tetratricopeptide (TPR) repeat protein